MALSPSHSIQLHAASSNITVGVVREVKALEFRVGVSPGNAREFVRKGHKVMVERGAGENSGFSDEEYVTQGCRILGTAKEVYSQADIIMKVKEPLPCEYDLIRPNQIIFTFFHFAASRELTEAMICRGAVCVAYETIEKEHHLPLLIPMSEVAGRMAVQEAAKYLERPHGRGVLLGGVPGVKPAKVLIIGAGVVGTSAAKVACGVGADVVILDVNLQRLRQLDDYLPPNAKLVFSTEDALCTELKVADVVIGAVLIPGAKAPKIVRKDHLKMMKKGAVIVDVAVDQGGCVETCHPTTHDDPIYVVDGVVHYCVANMPGACPFTSTLALCNATVPYGLALADLGWKEAAIRFPALKKGVNVALGKVTCPGVADAFDLELFDIESLLA